MNIIKASTRGIIILIGLLILTGIAVLFIYKNYPVSSVLLVIAVLWVAKYFRMAIVDMLKEEKFLESYDKDMPGFRIKLRDLKDEIEFLRAKRVRLKEENLIEIISEKEEEINDLEEKIKLYEEAREEVKEEYRKTNRKMT